MCYIILRCHLILKFSWKHLFESPFLFTLKRHSVSCPPKTLGFQAHCRAKPRQLHHEWSSTPAVSLGDFWHSNHLKLLSMSCLGWPFFCRSFSLFCICSSAVQRAKTWRCQGRNRLFPPFESPGSFPRNLQRMACRARGKKLEEMSPWILSPMHLYLAYPSNNTKQQGEGLQQLFPPLDKQPGWPSPQARAHTPQQQGDNPNTPPGG